MHKISHESGNDLSPSRIMVLSGVVRLPAFYADRPLNQELCENELGASYLTRIIVLDLRCPRPSRE